MESLNALIQGMGLMHLGFGQAVMLLVSLLLLWLAIARKFEPLLLLPIGFGGLLCSLMFHPELGWDAHLRASIAAGTGACLAAGATPPSAELLARLAAEVEIRG